MKNQKDMTLKDEPPRSIGVQYASGKEWRNSSIRNEDADPKWKTKTKTKKHPVVDVSGGESKVQCCEEQYCIGIWTVHEAW